MALSRFFALALVLGVTGAAQAGSELDFKLVNETGYGVKELYIALSSQEEWSYEDKVALPHSIKDKPSVDITFNPRNTAEKWDLKIIWAEKTTAETE